MHIVTGSTCRDIFQETATVDFEKRYDQSSLSVNYHTWSTENDYTFKLQFSMYIFNES